MITMQVIIDRFEEDYAVVELPDKNMINVPRILFPEAQEGDVIKIIVDNEEINKRKEEITALSDNLFC